VNLWRWADRALLETVVPPVFGKESLLNGTYVAILGHLLSRCFFMPWGDSLQGITVKRYWRQLMVGHQPPAEKVFRQPVKVLI